ncbi:MAG: DUF2975 domain-containing protein [Gemmatimonadaceae bacterium]
MPQSSPGALPLARKVLRALVVLNVGYGLAIFALLASSLIAPDAVFAALGVRPTADDSWRLVAMRLIMVVGIASVPIAHLILKRLQAIIETVRAGDPFVTGNAARLETIAWAVLGLQLLHLVVGAIAGSASTDAQPLDIDWSFSFTPWIAVLLLFVLARVFDHGTRMRADLEGTV